MTRCLISFGANLGEPAATINQAVELLHQLLSGHLRSLALSRLFKTPAVGGPAGQPPFINAVAALEVENISAWELWHVVRQIENQLGRVRQERWEARRIDLDVLLVDDQRIWTQHFKLPHPRMVMRRFILEPALDVAATWIEPVSGNALSQLASSLRSGPASITLVSDTPKAAQDLLEQAAAESQSQWIAPQYLTEHTNTTQTNAVEPTRPPTIHAKIHHRWLGTIAQQTLLQAENTSVLTPQPLLVVVLAPAVTKPGAAWEDIHRDLARWMQLCPSGHPTGQSTPWPLTGARYLLATDDRKWAVHEIVAALEAMDCPVEAL